MRTLESIGFYTLSDARVKQASINSPLWRCELVLTARCNFRCPYCRHIGGRDLDYQTARQWIGTWAAQGLKNIRFSGGEPTLWRARGSSQDLTDLVRLARELGIERIAVSTNGSASIDMYQRLIAAGVNDFSVSLDACCAEDGDKMAGNIKGSWDTVITNIRLLAKCTYVTVGIVLIDTTMDQVNDLVRFAHSLGVADIRIIPAAQCSLQRLRGVEIDEDLAEAHPILSYRIENMQAGSPVRGLQKHDTNRCGLVVDDMAVMGDKHYPCIIYMRELGKLIGRIGPHMRQERAQWATEHDTHTDPICSKNCLDVCVDYNNRFAEYRQQ